MKPVEKKIMKGSGKVKKFFKRLVASALALTMSLGLAATGIASQELSTKWKSNGNVVTEDLVDIGLSDETKAYALDVTERLADEGMVLIKNENDVLPLTEGTKIAVFGSGRWNTSRSDSRTGYISFADALNASEKLEANTSLMGTTNALDAEALAAVCSETDVAVIVLQRGTSEGNESANYSLSAGETALIEQVCDSYDKVVVVLNTVCQIASDWMLDAGIDSVLWAGQPGNRGGQSAVDILTGDVNPSGRLVDTWAAGGWDAYPSSAHWGVDETIDGVPTVYYTDDIYVGYRYFETFDVPVNYEFGFGLSYTDFEWSNAAITPNWTEGTITAAVDVKNTGDTSGKDVVEIYYSYPDTQGLISLDVPSIQLVQYGKTDILEPGESETVEITFDMADLAIYNESSTCWQMYAGDYQIKFGHSVKDIEATEMFSYTSTTSVKGGTLGHKLTPQVEIEVLKDTAMDGQLLVNSKEVTRYYDEDADHSNSAVLGTGETLTDEEINGTGKGYTLTQVKNGEITMDELLDDMSLLELLSMLSGVSNGAPFLNPYYDANGDGAYTFDEMVAEINRNINCSYTGLTNGIVERDILNVTMVDRQESVSVTGAYDLDEEGNVVNIGNSGFGFQVYPSSVVIASTWNQELIEEYGTAIGNEMKEAGMDVWFSPSMNIHRNPAGGRNSEYYSEDPVISGYSAASAVKGVERLGLSVTLKHFFGNNQEEQRRQINEVISERAIREIYLKGYEIVVEETADMEEFPGFTGFMSSYNKVNGSWTSESYDLIQGIVIGEWGASGWVVTDYQMECDLYKALAAGTCIWAPTIPGAVGNVSDSDRAMFTTFYNDVAAGEIPLDIIKSNVSRTLEVAMTVLPDTETPDEPAASADVIIGNVDALAGEDVEIDVTIENNPGIAGYLINIVCDTEYITITDVIQGSTTFGGNYTTCETANGYKVLWSNSANNAIDGTLVTIKAAVSEEAPDGTYPITATYSAVNTLDENREEVALNIVNGSITVLNVTPGDIDDNGIITNADIILLARYLVNLEELSEKQLLAADYNGDGKINNADVVALARYVVEIY